MNIKSKILFSIVAVLMLVYSLTGCVYRTSVPPPGWTWPESSSSNEGTSASDVGIKVTAIYLSDSIVSLSVGDTYTIAASIYPTNATDRTVVWTSSKDTIAAVDDGKVTAKALGTAKITARASNGDKKVCTVKVVKKIIVPYYISLNKTLVTLNVGDVDTLVATINPSNAADKTVTWKSSNSMIVFVEDGKITAVSAGNAVITAVTSNKLVTTCLVRVDDTVVEPNLVGISATSINLQTGKTFSLTASIIPANATDKSVTWDTSNGAVATVDDGTVTAHSPGIATITVTSSNGITAECVVTVSK